MTTSTLFIIIAVILVGVVAWRFMIPSLAGVISAAREQRDIKPIIEAVSKIRESARPTAYNHAIRQLWDAYERELAIELVKELARNHHESLIAQYWLKQVLQVEPKLATKAMSREFLNRYYRPEVAAQCGPVG